MGSSWPPRDQNSSHGVTTATLYSLLSHWACHGHLGYFYSHHGFIHTGLATHLWMSINTMGSSLASGRHEVTTATLYSPLSHWAHHSQIHPLGSIWLLGTLSHPGLRHTGLTMMILNSSQLLDHNGCHEETTATLYSPITCPTGLTPQPPWDLHGHSGLNITILATPQPPWSHRSHSELTMMILDSTTLDSPRLHCVNRLGLTKAIISCHTHTHRATLKSAQQRGSPLPSWYIHSPGLFMVTFKRSEWWWLVAYE